MKRKKVIAIVMSSLLLFGLCACGNEKGTSTTEPPKTNTESSEAEKESKDGDEIKAGKKDKEARVLPKELEYNIKVEADEFGFVEGTMTLKNNSKYTIKNFDLKVEYTTEDGKKDETYFMCEDSILPGEVKDTIRTVCSNEYKPISLEYQIFDKESMCSCYVTYEYNTEVVKWEKWMPEN